MRPSELAAIVVDEYPDLRPAILVHAEFLLDEGDSERALELIERALRIDSVCQTAQQLLMRGKQSKTDLSGKFCHVPFTHFSTGLRGPT